AKAHLVFTVFDRCCPWEHARAMRVLDLIDLTQLHCLDVLDQAPPGQDPQQWAEVAGAVPPETSQATYAALDQRQYLLTGHHAGKGDFFFPQQPGTLHQERAPWNWLKTTFPLNLSFRQSDLTRIWGLKQRRDLSFITMYLRLKLVKYKK